MVICEHIESYKPKIQLYTFVT